jgi:hypothetical protein
MASRRSWVRIPSAPPFERTYRRKPLTVTRYCCQLCFFLLHSNVNLSRFVRKTDMAQYTLIARINASDGEFPFVNVQFSKNHRPIPIERATYYLRPSNSGKRTPIRIGKDVAVAHTALIRMEDGQPLECIAALHAGPPSSIPTAALRRRVVEAAREYIVASRNRASRSGQISLARLPRYMSKWIIFERAVMQR